MCRVGLVSPCSARSGAVVAARMAVSLSHVQSRAVIASPHMALGLGNLRHSWSLATISSTRVPVHAGLAHLVVRAVRVHISMAAWCRESCALCAGA
eukprot:4093778-Alexandrium_andersonii.AAC.1